MYIYITVYVLYRCLFVITVDIKLGFVWCTQKGPECQIIVVRTTHMCFDLESDFLFLRQAVVPAVQPLRPGPVQAESRNSSEFISRHTTPVCRHVMSLRMTIARRFNPWFWPKEITVRNWTKNCAAFFVSTCRYLKWCFPICYLYELLL